ncbi:Glycosyl transferases group 1 [Salinibacillus kushneri]|uniref:Glycosyl transferases group 1 n=1 Tax=Salinibacillus kushneri TaxID=237682 RepID=A0A1H9YHE7_9BACI|nr:glycosyltransferase family 4 protein [Salinibacillus kushneri]SES68395.1 Glycosyl transferases group 1 [Salinibacillus kushneri]
MKVVLATPHFHQPRGNTVTVQRIADGLEKLGVTTEIVSITDEGITALPEADMVHGFHAYKFYRFMQKINDIPKTYMITITGTDLNYYLFDSKTRAEVMDCLEGAKAIHVFNEKGKHILEKEVPSVSDKVFILPQGTSEFSESDFPVQKEDNTFVFTLPAGIRKIKNVPSAIKMLSKLHFKYPQTRLWIVGPVLEEQEGAIVKELVEENRDWVTYFGQVDHKHMGSIYAKTDSVINTSDSEGQSSAILEAMGFGLPVLASDNEGNKSIITHQQNGLIFSNESHFLDYAEQLMNHKKWTQHIGNRAEEYVRDKHSGSYEAKYLLSIYMQE